MPSKQTIKLKASERKMLLKTVRTGVNSAQTIMRAHILLKSSEGWTDRQIAEAFNASSATVRRMRLKGLGLGVIPALREATRSGQPAEISQSEEQMLVALVCSKPPSGYARWTVRLLTREAIAHEYVHRVAPETVRRVLKKTRSSHGR